MRLRPLRFIKDFRVGQAQYQLFDEANHPITLLVDYANNQFQLEGADGLAREFVDEVSQIARGLLARKHAVNLANKKHYLIEVDSGLTNQA